MKHVALFAAVCALPLLTASCSKNEPSSGEWSAGGSSGPNSDAGGAGGSGVTGGSTGSSKPSGSGGTTGSDSSSNSGGSGAATSLGGSSSYGSNTSNTRNTVAVGGLPASSGGSGGAATSTTKRDTVAAGGTPGSRGGSTGSGGAKGSAAGTTGFSAGGKTGAGGTRATAGAPGIAGSGTGGKTGAGGETGTAGAPGSTPSTGCGKATTLTSARASIDVSGKAREYILALPKNYDQNHAYKLVFAWHPWMGSAQQIASGGYYGLQKEANNEAIFVAGEGLNFTQGDKSGLGWGNANGEDIAFYHAMLDRFRSELCIDDSRIFSVGFSFGAMFSFTLGCTSESMTRAIVPMAGNTMTSGGCESGTRSVAVMAFIGLQDTLLDGHRQAVTTYTKRDGCTTTSNTLNPSWCDGLSSTNLPCTCVNYQGCKDGYPVISCEYTAGHQQAPNPGPIWDFLAQF